MVKSIRCQKCDSPLKIDPSIINLSKAQEELITGRLLSLPKMEKPIDSNDFIPPERLELLKEVNSSEPRPLYYQDFSSHDVAEEDSEENDETEGGSRTDDEAGLLDSKSFVMLPSSDIVNADENEEESENNNNNNKQGNNLGGDNSNSRNNSKNNNTTPKTFSQRINTLNKIFKTLSTNQKIEHPLCIECCELLVENYKLKFDQNQKEKDHYLGFLRKLKSQEGIAENENLSSSLNATQKEYELLAKEEETKLQELQSLESQRDELDEELKKLEKYYDELVHGKFQQVLQLKNETEFNLLNAQDKLEKYKASYQNNLDELDRLRSFNVYTEIFNISSDGDFATINGYRLGYKVPWPENNAALGQIVLLLLFILKRLSLQIKNYKLVPVGSKSYIIKLGNKDNKVVGGIGNNETGITTNGPPSGSDRTTINNNTSGKIVLQLYTSNEFSLGKLFNFNKLDVSMIALLDIVHQFETHLISRYSDLEFPFVISLQKHTIGNKNIRVTSNGEWTTSCKNLLTNLNWLLQYSTVTQSVLEN